MTMTFENEAQFIYWQEHDYQETKEKYRMLKFQAATYRNRLTQQRKALEVLRAGQDDREKAYKPMFKTTDELWRYYVNSDMSFKDYAYQRSRIWQVYSDRGHINNIKWLEEELAKVEAKIKALDKHVEELTKMSEYYRPSAERKRKTDYERKRRRKIRQKEKEERWKKYGIG